MSLVSSAWLQSTDTSRSMRLNRMAETKPRFVDIYHTHKDAIYSFVLYRVGNNRDVAEDIVSDVFLKAYRNFDSYNTQYQVTTWLYTITRNTLIDHYRKGRVTLDIDDVPIADTEDPLYRLVTEDISEREVHEAIAQLPAIQQQAITGQFFAGKTAKELAAELGISHAATRKHVSRGLAALRRALLLLVVGITPSIVILA